ncbi:MAG TPA: ATP-binding protein [Lacunisphaera sp.]|jgi:PAS domain S-box-containing protein
MPQTTPTTNDMLLDRALVTAFLANIPDCVYFKDRESRFIALSSSLADKHGQQGIADIIGKTDFDFFSKDHAQPAFDDEQAIIKTGKPLLGKLERETWADGRVSWVLTNKLPLRNEKGEIIGTFGISKDITESKQMEAALEKSQRELIDASRLAGMAEVATGVLHNVGNVLNSLNVSTDLIASTLRQSKADSLVKVGEMLREHAAELGSFVTEDPKGKLVLGFIESLGRHFAEDRARLLKEIESLQKNVDHIKEIVSMQQTYATMVGVVEELQPLGLIEDAVRMNAAALVRHDVRVVRDFAPVPPVLAEKAKVLQILVNLIRNAKYAADEGGAPDKIITLRIRAGDAGRVQLIVQDNGIGIPAENLTRIFQHGFTTKATGHGFGLHSSANAAKEMRGTLNAFSDGPGCGASFVLDLPVFTHASG